LIGAASPVNVIGQGLQKTGFDQRLDHDEHAGDKNKRLPIDVAEHATIAADGGTISINEDAEKLAPIICSALFRRYRR
jgi:hypothetical protein